jgi:hypothetical protein
MSLHIDPEEVLNPTLDPRQKLCWEYYVDPKSETFANGKQSAIRAGFGEGYADRITTAEWFKMKLEIMNMFDKSERVLNEMLDMPVEVLEHHGRGEEAETVVVTSPALVKVKQDTAKYVSERLGKKKWSQRVENTGADGKDLIPTPLLANLKKENVHNNNSPEEVINDVKEDPGSAGGDISEQDD